MSITVGFGTVSHSSHPAEAMAPTATTVRASVRMIFIGRGSSESQVDADDEPPRRGYRQEVLAVEGSVDRRHDFGVEALVVAPEAEVLPAQGDGRGLRPELRGPVAGQVGGQRHLA